MYIYITNDDAFHHQKIQRLQKLFTLKIDAVTGKKEPKITGWQNQKGAKLVTMESAAVTKAVLTGKVGGVTVIDFDSVPAYILFTMDFPFLLDTFRVKTRKGYQ